jgi:hypothetical protein
MFWWILCQYETLNVQIGHSIHRCNLKNQYGVPLKVTSSYPFSYMSRVMATLRPYKSHPDAVTRVCGDAIFDFAWHRYTKSPPMLARSTHRNRAELSKGRVATVRFPNHNASIMAPPRASASSLRNWLNDFVISPDAHIISRDLEHENRMW